MLIRKYRKAQTYHPPTKVLQSKTMGFTLDLISNDCLGYVLCNLTSLFISNGNLENVHFVSVMS